MAIALGYSGPIFPAGKTSGDIKSGNTIVSGIEAKRHLTVPANQTEPALPWWREVKTTLLLAFPVMVGNLSQMLIGVTDTIMIGHLGVVPLATANFANNLVSIFFVCAIGFFTAVSVRTSQLRGAQVYRLIPASLWHGLVLGLLCGLLILAIIWGFQPYLHILKQPEEVLSAAPEYLFLVTISLIPAIITLVYKNFAEAFERPWVPLYLTLAGVVLNIVLNYALIYGNWGFPRMELEGAAWATLISRVFTLLLFIVWLYKSPFFSKHMPGWGQMKISFAETKVYLQLGIPPSLHLLAEVSAFAGAAFMMGWIGEVEMAAHQIALVSISTIFMIPLGLAMSGTIRLGKAYGAQAWRSLPSLALSVVIPGILFNFVFALLLWFEGERIASWFIDDTTVIHMVAMLFTVASLFLVSDGLQVIATGCLRGVSDVRVSMAIGISGYVGVALPCGYWFAFRMDMGATGIWAGLATAVTLVAIALAARLYLKVTRPTITVPVTS